MKKIVRNNLYLVASAWCLILNDYPVISLVVLALLISYMVCELEKKNIWRVISISIVSFILSYLLARITILNYIDNFMLFCLLNSINIGLLFEAICKCNRKALYVDLAITMLAFVLFIFIATILPSKFAMGGSRANLYGLILLIFIPYSSILAIVTVNNIFKGISSFNVSSIS